MDIISRVFARSPFHPLRLQSEAIQAYLVRIEPMDWVARFGRTDEVEQSRADLCRVSAEAHQLCQEVRGCLARGLVFAASRERLIAIADVGQSMLETGRELTRLLQRCTFDVPEELRDALDVVLRMAIQTACLAEELVRRLERLAEFGFGGPEMDTFRGLLKDVDASKAACDERRGEFEQKLDLHQNALGPSDLIHSVRVVDELRRLATRAERLAGGVRSLIDGEDPAIRPLEEGWGEAADEANRKTGFSNPSVLFTNTPEGDDVLETV